MEGSYRHKVSWLNFTNLLQYELCHGVPGLSQFRLNPCCIRILSGKRTSQYKPCTYNYTYTLENERLIDLIACHHVLSSRFFDVLRLFFRGFVVLPFSLVFSHMTSLSARCGNGMPHRRVGKAGGAQRTKSPREMTPPKKMLDVTKNTKKGSISKRKIVFSNHHFSGNMVFFFPGE